MAQKKDEKRSVVFRRIGGRIVPIAIGAGAIGAGVKMSKPKPYKPMKVVGFHSNLKLTYPDRAERAGAFASKMSDRYHKEIKDAGVRAIGTHVDSSSVFSYQERFGKTITMGSPRRSSFLHELGHAQQATPKKIKRVFGATDAYNNRAIKINKKLSELSSELLKSKTKKNLYKLKSVNVLADLNMSHRRFTTGIHAYIDEADAWRRAYKIAHNKREKRAVFLAAKKAMPTYSHLVRGKIGFGLGALGLGLVGYGLLKKDKK